MTVDPLYIQQQQQQIFPCFFLFFFFSIWSFFLWFSFISDSSTPPFWGFLIFFLCDIDISVIHLFLEWWLPEMYEKNVEIPESNRFLIAIRVRLWRMLFSSDWSGSFVLLVMCWWISSFYALNEIFSVLNLIIMFSFNSELIIF